MNSSTLGQNIPRASATTQRSSGLRAVLLAGSAAAATDLLFAFAFFGWQLGATPLRVMQSVATGLYGRAAFDGGLSTAAAGFVAHFVILIVAAACYYLASRRIAMLTQRPLLAGVLFGLALYVAMTFGIVPLSAARYVTPTLRLVDIGQFLIHPVIGVQIALILRRFAPRR